jgi:hypothetical protein
MSHPQPDQESAVKRVVGISVLRRLRQLVDEENAQQRNNALWAFRIGIGFVIVLVIVLLFSQLLR